MSHEATADLIIGLKVVDVNVLLLLQPFIPTGIIFGFYGDPVWQWPRLLRRRSPQIRIVCAFVRDGAVQRALRRPRLRIVGDDLVLIVVFLRLGATPMGRLAGIGRLLGAGRGDDDGGRWDRPAPLLKVIGVQ